MVRRLVPAATFAALAVSTALGCQYLPFASSGGQLQMRVAWPFRTQVIPEGTAAVAVAVFKDGTLVPARSGKKLTIIGKGAGTAVYPGLNSGRYRVVAAAFNGEVVPTAGGASETDVTAGNRSQVTIDLNAAGAGNAGEMNAFIKEVEDYIKGPTASPSPTATPSPTTSQSPTASSSPAPAPTASSSSVPVPSPSATATAAAGGGGGSSSTGVTFTGGF